jgi:GNAT superfamily N-acetyltransferase
VLIDLCPMADGGLIHNIVERGYRVIEFNNVMVRRIAPGEQIVLPATDVQLAGVADLPLWNRTIARGFQEKDDVDEAFIDMLSGSAVASRCYLARIGGEPAGGGAMSIHDGVAAFYGDSTVLRARRQGVQFATLQARLRDAAAVGCDLAMACVLPGSGSHRNYEKAGFRLFFMRVNLILP